jgi:Uncharacterized conserved protein
MTYSLSLADLGTLRTPSEPSHYELYKDARGHWRWRLIASNGRTVADSGEGYHNKNDCLSGLNLVKRSLYAPVYDA